MASNTSTYQNQTFTTVEIGRTATITLKTIGESTIKTEQLFVYLQSLSLIEDVECIQRLSNSDIQYHEVTFKSDEIRITAEEKLTENEIHIDNKTLQVVSTRKLKDVIRNPVTKVIIFEAPYELSDRFILQKLQQYGELNENSVYNHTFRGSTIYNGVRSVNFKRISKPIPTTLLVRGNRLKIKHEGQDRTPVCGICKEKGHYRDRCPNDTPLQDLDADQKEDQPVQRVWANIVKAGIKEDEEQRNRQRQMREEMFKQNSETETSPKVIIDSEGFITRRTKTAKRKKTTPIEIAEKNKRQNTQDLTESQTQENHDELSEMESEHEHDTEDISDSNSRIDSDEISENKTDNDSDIPNGQGHNWADEMDRQDQKEKEASDWELDAEN